MVLNIDTDKIAGEIPRLSLFSREDDRLSASEDFVVPVGDVTVIGTIYSWETARPYSGDYHTPGGVDYDPRESILEDLGFIDSENEYICPDNFTDLWEAIERRYNEKNR